MGDVLEWPQGELDLWVRHLKDKPVPTQTVPVLLAKIGILIEAWILAQGAKPGQTRRPDVYEWFTWLKRPDVNDDSAYQESVLDDMARQAREELDAGSR